MSSFDYSVTHGIFSGKDRLGNLEDTVSAMLNGGSLSARTPYKYLSQMGLALDGTTDDSAAFATAVTAAETGGYELILDGSMKLSSQLVRGQTTLRLRGVDPSISKIIQADYATDHYLFDLGGYGGSTTNPQALTSDAAKGATTLVVANGSGYAAGDTLILTAASSPWAYSDKGAYRGEIVRVGSRSGNTLTLREPLDDNYTVALGGSVKKVVVSSNFLLEGVTLVNGAPDTHQAGFFRLRGFFDPVIRNVVVQDPDSRVFQFNCCDGFDMDDIRFLDGHDNPTRGGYVYGIEAYGCTRNGRARNLFGRGMRHVFTTTSGSEIEGIPRHCHVAHGDATMCTNAAWDTHPEGELITFEDLHAHNTLAWAFQLRAPNSTAANCTADENLGAAFWIRADNIRLIAPTSRRARTGTIFSTAGDPGASYDGQGIRIGDGPTIVGADGVTALAALVEDCDADAIYIGTGSDKAIFTAPIVRRPGALGSNQNAVRFSGTSQDHQFKAPTFENCSVAFVGTTSITGVKVDNPDYRSTPVIVSGGMPVPSSNALATRQQNQITAQGFTNQNFERDLAVNNNTMIGGTAYAMVIGVTPGDLISNVYVHVGGAGATVTLFKAGVYSIDGATQYGASADQSALFASVGVKTIPITTPFYVPAGVTAMMIVVVATATTLPGLRGNAAGSMTSGQLGSNAWPYATAGTGLSNLPAVTVTYASTNTPQAYWCAYA